MGALEHKTTQVLICLSTVALHFLSHDWQYKAKSVQPIDWPLQSSTWPHIEQLITYL